MGSLRGDMQLFSEEGTFDPAAWEDWVDCVKAVLKEKETKKSEDK